MQLQLAVVLVSEIYESLSLVSPIPDECAETTQSMQVIGRFPPKSENIVAL